MNGFAETGYNGSFYVIKTLPLIHKAAQKDVIFIIDDDDSDVLRLLCRPAKLQAHEVNSVCCLGHSSSFRYCAKDYNDTKHSRYT
jgi:hypothetical protein